MDFFLAALGAKESEWLISLLCETYLPTIEIVYYMILTERCVSIAFPPFLPIAKPQ